MAIHFHDYLEGKYAVSKLESFTVKLYHDRYGESFPVSAESLDSSFCLPIGKAKVHMFCLVFLICPKFLASMSYSVIFLLQVEKEGKDVTITAFSKMVGYALQVNIDLMFHFLNEFLTYDLGSTYHDHITTLEFYIRISVFQLHVYNKIN